MNHPNEPANFIKSFQTIYVRKKNKVHVWFLPQAAQPYG